MFSFLSVLLILVFPDDMSVVRFHRTGDDGCSFTVNVSEPIYREYGGKWYPVLKGMAPSLKKGMPVLPSLTVYVPLPPGVVPTLEYSSSGRISTGYPGPAMICPLPSGEGLRTSWSFPGYSVEEIRDKPVAVSVFRLAGTRVAAVEVSPFSGTDGEWIPSRIDVKLSWPGVSGGRKIDLPLLDFVCHDGLMYWPAAERGKGGDPFWGRPWARMSVKYTGVYLVTGRLLEESGVPVTGTPSAALRVFTGPGMMFDLENPADEHELTEIPVEVMDGGDGVFDACDTLKFFGLGLSRLDLSGSEPVRLMHRYATHNVYWLTWGAENGARMDTLEALPNASPPWGDSLEYYIWQEQDYIWVGGQDTLTGWVWTQLFEDIPGYFYFSTPSAVSTGTLRLSIIPEYGNYGPHSMFVDLNGKRIADTTWASANAVEIVLEDVDLDESMNLLKVTVDESPGKVYLDYVMVEYSRSLAFAANRLLKFSAPMEMKYSLSLGGAASRTSLLDVSDPLAPSRIGGELRGDRLVVSLDLGDDTCLWLEGAEGFRTPDSIVPAQPGRIKGTAPDGDVVVVVADSLLDTALPLEGIYADRGLKAVLVTTKEVYDEFGQGIRDPGAIRSFFRYTQDAWSKPASALLLVGDGTLDPLMHITAFPTLVPIFHLLAAGYGKNMDDGFVIAHEDGMFPEVPVSRIPAASRGELSLYLSKLERYEARSNPGSWENRLLLVADDEWGNGFNDYEHTESCELMADTILPTSMERVKFYLIEYPWPPGTTPSGVHPEKPAARLDFIEELSRGCSGMIYFGHGSYGQLAHEKLLVSSDVQLVDNGDRLPVMIFASCDVSHFDMISAKCLAEDFTMAPGSGSIVSIGSTRSSFSGGNEALFSSYYEFQYGDSLPDVAKALWAAKVLGTPSSYANSKTYVILGDGGVRPAYPSTAGCNFRVEGDTLHRGRINTVTGSSGSGSTFFVNVTESGRPVVYSGIGSGSVEYLRYGLTVFRGLVKSDEGGFSASFFMPLQADTGAFARGSALGLKSGSGSVVGYEEWITFEDDGDHVKDSLPPEIEMWLRGRRGVENPVVGPTCILKAVLVDSSGICAMGGGAGRSILLSLDGRGFDISNYFEYFPGSHGRGNLEYDLPEMLKGRHRLIMAVWDGMGNASRDTLDFTVIGNEGDVLSSVFVYPNPGMGLRSFNFDVAENGIVDLEIFTVSGRRIWKTTESCREGYNQVLWDGTDMDGEPVARGTYIYKLRLNAPDGNSASVVDVLVVAGEG